MLFPWAAVNAQNGIKANISDSIDVLHYDINLRLVNLSNKRISGYTDVRIVPLINGISSFRLWLQSLTIDSVRINGMAATYVAYDDTLMRIGLPVTMNITDTFTARVYYQGLPVVDGSDWGGFYFSSDSNFAYNLGVGFQSVPHNYGRVWFPCIDDFVDRATYDCYITTKNTKMAVCGGTLISGTDLGDGTKVWHWALHNSIPTYLASVAVGPYVPVNGTFNGQEGNIPTAIYVRASDTNNAKASFINLNNFLSVFETRFGPYGWERVGYVGVPFNNGAMEHVSNIAYPLACITGSLSYESLYAHELSHMWFGDLVTCATAEDMWINEGWARYCEAIGFEGIYGRPTYDATIRDLHKGVLQFAHVEDNGYRALYGIPPEYTYGTTVYDKGGDVAHTLRGYLGDTLFFPALKMYFAVHAYNHISSVEMRDYLTFITGVDLTSFFDAWVFSPGFPHFSIDSFQVSGTAPASVTVFVRQRLDHAPAYANHNILDITFMKAGQPEFTDTIHFSGAGGVKTFTVPFVPDAVILDKYDRISDALTSYSYTIKNTGLRDFLTTYCVLDVKSITDSAWVRIEHNFVPPDPMKTANPDILRLSNYRYWKVDGLFPPGFVAKGKFRYNNGLNTVNGYLDNVLMHTSQSRDSLLLLYREGPWDDWKIEPFTLYGAPAAGDLIVDTIHRGEYTLAIGTPVHFGIEQHRGQKDGGMKVYPNPSDSDFLIDWTAEDAMALQMFSADGKLSEALDLSGLQSPIRWKPGNIEAGTYVVKLYNKKQELIGQEKIIYLP